MGSSDQNTGTGRDSRDPVTPKSSDQPKRTISGPGAADFIAAPGGIDTPESDPAKGTRAAAEESPLTAARDLTPDLDEPRDTTEREWLVDERERRPDSTK